MSEVRLIDANDLKAKIKSKYDADDYDEFDKGYNIGLGSAVDLIDSAPTVPNEYMRGYEAAEREYKRPQGEWIERVEHRGCYLGVKTVYSYTCPFCGVKEYEKHPFCHCGADMRKEEEND